MDPSPAPAGRMPLSDTVITAASLAAIAVLFFLHPVGTSDLFWQMKAGEVVWQTGSVPHTDIFSFTAAGRPWVDHEWLAGLLFYGVWRAGGFTALSLLSLALGAGIVGAIFAGARRLSGSSPIAVLLALAVCAAGAQRFQQLRPDLFAFLFFAMLLGIVFSACAGARRRLWLLVPLSLIWANVHASAIIGPPLIVIAGGVAIIAARRRGVASPLSWRLLLAVALASVAALVVNPYGPKIYAFPFEHIGQGFALAVTSDWARATWVSPQADIAAWGLGFLAAAAVAAIARRRGAPFPWGPAAIAAACLPAGLWMMRFVPFAAIALAMLIAALLRGPAGEASRSISLARVAAPLAAFGALLLFFQSGPIQGARFRDGGVDVLLGLPVGTGFAARDFPVEAVDALDRSGIEGRLFNDMSWGGYLIWRRWPAREVFIDTRTPVYGDAFLEAYSDALFDAAAFEELVERWGITHVLYDAREIATDGGPLTFLLSDARWRPAFLDANAAIFVRRAPPASP